MSSLKYYITNTLIMDDITFQFCDTSKFPVFAYFVFILKHEQRIAVDLIEPKTLDSKKYQMEQLTKNETNLMEAFIIELDQFPNYISRIRNAGIPKYLNKKFLENLDIKSPNSVFYTKLFMALDLVDDKGRPLENYSRFIKSEKNARLVFAEKIKACYDEIYQIEKNAHKLSKEKAREVFRSVLKGEKSETFIRMIADTYKTLADFADWEAAEKLSQKENEKKYLNKSDEKSSSHVEFIMELMRGNSTHSYRKDQITPKNKNITTPDQIVSKSPVTLIKNENDTDNSSEKDTIKPKKQPAKVSAMSPKQDVYLSKVLERKANILKKMERYEEAVSTFDQIINRYKDSGLFSNFTTLSETYIQKAELLEKLEDYERALGTYDNYLQMLTRDEGSQQIQNVAQ